MKKIRQTRYNKTKHRHDITFVAPVNLVENSTKMPAYNASGLKEYVRVLPPVRDQRIIDTRLLAHLLNTKTVGNNAEVINDGIILNQVEVKINEGVATAAGTKFRYTDLWSLLGNLFQEHVLNGDMHDVRVLRESYFKSDE